MKYITRIVSVLTGLLFLVSGLGKLPDISGFQNLIIQYGFPAFQYLAPFIVLAEFFLGLALVLGLWRNKATICAIVLLLLFTGVYTYGLKEHAIQDCGCFGHMVKSTPLLTYLRNILLFIALTLILFLGRNEPDTTTPSWKKQIFWTVMLPSIFLAGMSFRLHTHKKYSHPLEGKIISETPLAPYAGPTTSGRRLISFMLYQCSHCINSIENYKAYTEKGIVDTAMCYMLLKPESVDEDSMILRFKNFYPEVSLTEIHKDSIGFLTGFPTSFFINKNKIEKVIQGELPSPLLLFPIITSIKNK